MKKLLCALLAATVLSGCVCKTTGHIEQVREIAKTPKVYDKTELYCYHCDTDYLRKYFITGDENSRYSITLDVKDMEKGGEMYWDDWAMLPWNIVAMLNLFLVVPAYNGSHNYLAIQPILHDKQTGMMANLAPVKYEYTEWVTFFLAPFLYKKEALDPEWPLEMAAWNHVMREKSSEIFLKEAALKIYNSNIEQTNWVCENYSCRFGEIIAKKTTTADDVLYVAQNTSSYNEFEKAKNKLAKPLTTEQNCQATKPLLQNGVIAKNTGRYWALVDFYKGNCSVSGEFGMTKEMLISLKGIPSNGYKVNADTEIISYSSLSRNGENVITTTYTLDRGIVTSVK